MNIEVNKRYIPTALRALDNPPTTLKPCYGIGKMQDANSWGMTHGPVDKELDLLEICGEEGDYILYLTGEESTPIWRWVDGGWNTIDTENSYSNILPVEDLPITELKLTNDQQQAWIDIQAWLKDPEPYFILKGPAGTGKTHMLKMLLANTTKQVYLSAPTNKATKVLSTSLKHPAKTTYSLFGLRMQQEEDSLVLTASQTPYFPYGSIVVVDEAGTVNTALCKAVMQAAASMGLKVIFVGDPYQLPPVGERRSPAWKIPTKFKARLREVVRFDNQLLKLAVKIRRCITDKNYVSPLCSDHDLVKGIWKYKNQNSFTSVMLKRVAEDVEFTKVVAWRNKTVEHYNNLIRSRLGFNDVYNVGDLLMLSDPVHEDGTIIAHTDDEFICKHIEESEIALGGFGDIVTIPVYTLNLLNEEQVLTVNVPKRTVRLDAYLSKLARIARSSSGVGRKQCWDEFWSVKQRFTYVRYGYAITAHRAQGSTYNEVFVDQQDILSNPDKLTAFQCLNVACTRPTTRLNTF